MQYLSGHWKANILDLAPPNITLGFILYPTDFYVKIASSC